jgi:hypothetical protein
MHGFNITDKTIVVTIVYSGAGSRFTLIICGIAKEPLMRGAAPKQGYFRRSLVGL